MARRVDPQRHEARRLGILDAALTVFAERGYPGTTTAEICRSAGIGSGTLFHYFPTKVDILLGILDLGVRETQEFAEELAAQTDPLVALELIIARAIDDARDPRVAGFVRAVSGVMDEPEVAVRLHAEQDAQRALVCGWIERAQRDAHVRVNLSPQRLASWVLLLFDGFVERVAVDANFSVDREAVVLESMVWALLRGDQFRAGQANDAPGVVG